VKEEAAAVAVVGAIGVVVGGVGVAIGVVVVVAVEEEDLGAVDGGT
jgi:hypothetical protein